MFYDKTVGLCVYALKTWIMNKKSRKLFFKEKKNPKALL